METARSFQNPPVKAVGFCVLEQKKPESKSIPRVQKQSEAPKSKVTKVQCCVFSERDRVRKEEKGKHPKEIKNLKKRGRLTKRREAIRLACLRKSGIHGRVSQRGEGHRAGV